MTTTATNTATSTWGIPDRIRRLLSKTILELRAAVEDDFQKQLVALGVRETGVQPIPSGRVLAAPDQRARDVASAVIKRDMQAGSTAAEAFHAFIRELAFTFLNRAVGLRCIDERDLLYVDGQPETAVKVDPARSASSLYWRVRRELAPTTPPREVWRETLRRAGAAISERIRVLFDPESEHAVLLPLQPVLQRVIDALNSPEIPADVYGEDELLGWVYMYYNADEKDAVYARLGKGKKLDRPEDLIAATCLYTERYVVDYLLQNTLGALWVEMHPESRLPSTWPYYVRPPDRDPAAQRTARPLREITLLDPACGSGHFLVRAFGMLADMYGDEGREAEDEIPHLILERNLHGIDIDARAVQIAALSLYLKGCALAGPDFRPRTLNLVAADAVLSGEEPPSEYLARFKNDADAEALVKGIWHGLANVREFGSLLHPERAVDEVVKQRRARERGTLWAQDDASWERWKRDLLQGLREEFERQAQSQDLSQRLFGEEAAKGVGLVEELGRPYEVVVMNPPYSGSKNLSERLKKFIERDYKEGKRDLYAAFIQRCRDFASRNGYVGMVTQQSWLFLRSFAALRKTVLESATVATLAHLGEHAFEESAAAGAFVALFTLRNAAPAGEHRFAAFRLIGPKSPAEKDALLQRAIKGSAESVRVKPRQSDFLPLPETPFVYWLRSGFFELLRSDRRLRDVAEVRQGLATADNERFVRFIWEVSRVGVVSGGKAVSGRWFWYAKGGRYQKWAGLETYVVNWEDGGKELYKFNGIPFGSAGAPIRNPGFYFRPGLTYTQIARGSLGVRQLRDSVFGHASNSIFPAELRPEALAALLNSRLATFLTRAIAQKIGFEVSHVQPLPLPKEFPGALAELGTASIFLKTFLVSTDPTERGFRIVAPETRCRPEGKAATLLWNSTITHSEYEAAEALLHSIEGTSERVVCDAYRLEPVDIGTILDETGIPAGWHPLLVGYDAIPEAPVGIVLGLDLGAQLRDHDHRVLDSSDSGRLKARLRALYQAGPGASPSDASDDDSTATGDEEDGSGETVALGARIPIPAETFIEELSQKLEVHPISVYWLLQEMREQEGLVCPPELKRHLEEYASVTLLRLLGYRWPEEDPYERQHGAILDPDLVEADGIIPLVACGEEPTAAQRIRYRLGRQFGEDGADQSEQEFRQWVGRSLEDWLKRDFFKRHVQQFKQRPIAWHLVSPERTFEALVLYHRLSRETLQKLRAKYAGGLIARLRADQDRARQRGEPSEVSRLQLQIEDVEEFRDRLERIERGDELKYRIRCRWKGEEENGRPGPYAPDMDDGVKVNIRPFQEAGVLAVREVIRKW